MFRRSVGYRLIRIGSSRGTRTGEPSAVMIYPISQKARQLVNDLRGVLARDIHPQLQLSFDHGPCPMTPILRAGILSNLPPPAPLQANEEANTVAAFAFGPRTLEAAIVSLRSYLTTHGDALAVLSAQAQTLIGARVFDGLDWTEAASRAGYPSVPAAMRAIRRAIRMVVLHATPELEAKKPRSN